MSLLLELPQRTLAQTLTAIVTQQTATGDLLPPLDPMHEVWASGVTYLRSREARKAESQVGDIYGRVYDAERPEMFFKSVGWRVAGQAWPIRIRRDAGWSVPEPELTLVINHQAEIVGYCAGNDVSSRDIEGENPLYLPQAKIYNGACALGPGIVLTEAKDLSDLPIQLEILRQGKRCFYGETRTSKMKRQLEELVSYLNREQEFPHGVLLMTGTGIVPNEDFSLQVGDVTRIAVGSLMLENEVRI